MSRFAWTVSGITQETKLRMSMKEFPDWVTGRGTPHPKCGWHLLWTGALAWIKRRKWAKDQHSSLLASWLRVQCDQSPQGDCHHDRSYSHTVSQIQTFPWATTRKSHHCAAGMIPPIHEATVKKMQCWCGDLKGALQMSASLVLQKCSKDADLQPHIFHNPNPIPLVKRKCCLGHVVLPEVLYALRWPGGIRTRKFVERKVFFRGYAAFFFY